MELGRAYTTVVVSKGDAAGYVYAGLRIPGAKVEIFTPDSENDKEAAVALHLATLLCEFQPPEADRDHFLTTAREEVRAAFDDPTDPAVLVGIHTSAGDAGVEQAQQISELAMLYDPKSN